MKKFTSKQFSRRPAEVYEAAREDGEVEITHDRHPCSFVMRYKSPLDGFNIIVDKNMKEGEIKIAYPPDGWQTDDPIPNVYVDEKIECPRHPNHNLGPTKSPRSSK